MQVKKTVKKCRILALPLADSTLSQEGVVTSTFNIVSELARKIEPVGNAYAKLQGKFMRNTQRE